MDRTNFVMSPPHPGTARDELVGYEKDAFTWARQQAALLRTRRAEELDWTNLADEIDDVANREYDKLESDLTIIVQHLLKWDHQPGRRSRSWVLSIREHRRRVDRLLSRNAGLHSQVGGALTKAYEDARDRALAETGLPEREIPNTLPYDWSVVMTREILWPEDEPFR